MLGVFNTEEDIVKKAFEKKFGKEVLCFNNLLKVYCAFLEATSNKIKDNDYPNWTILILLSQTLPLMNNGLELLATGYFSVSSSFLISAINLKSSNTLKTWAKYEFIVMLRLRSKWI